MVKQAYIAHYHIYKNAGSSINKSLQNYFGKDALIEFDKNEHTKNIRTYDAQLIEKKIKEDPKLRCFTAHNMVTDVHLKSKLTIVPIVFIRHPLLRIASVYRFEEQRQDDWKRSKYAQALDFEDWLHFIMHRENDIEGNNYQTSMLTLSSNNRRQILAHTPVNLYDIKAVIKRLETVPVVGVVEEFEESVKKLGEALEPIFPGLNFNASANRTKKITSWKAEVNKLEGELSQITLQKFKAFNTQDYELFHRYVYKLRT